MSANILESAVRRLIDRAAVSAPVVVDSQPLRSSPRSKILRLQLERAWHGQGSLVAKQVVGDGALERYERELAALRLLAALDLPAPVAPKLLAWDETDRLFLLEDLGDGSLAAILLGKDRAAARAALLAYASALGRLHASTIDRETRATAAGQEFAGNPAATNHSGSIEHDAASFRQLCGAVGAVVDTGFDADVQRAKTLLAAPGPFRGLTHGDPCPDNERLTDTRFAFLDFEAAGFDHVLLDAAYLCMAFPTCWCAAAIPADILAESLAVYRQTLSLVGPEAADEVLFSRHLQCACARWLLTGDTLVPRARRGTTNHFMDALTADWSWGCSTARQRLQSRLQAFVELSRTVDGLPGMTSTVDRLHRILASRWPADVHRLPDYPAFGAADRQER